MDPQMAYAMERWNQMLNAQAGIRMGENSPLSNPMLGLYRHVLNQSLLNNPAYGNMDPDMLMRLMQRESNWNPAAVGRADSRGEQALGIMQIKPSTAEDMVRRKRVPRPENLMNPDENIEVGLSYLNYLKRHYGGDWAETLQRYHLGPTAYNEGKRDTAYSDYILGRKKAPFDPESSGYDEEIGKELAKKYPLTIPKPGKYQGDYVTQKDAFQAWVWHPEKNDYVMHSGSLDPRTGMVLKGRQHPTWDLMMEEENRLGNKVIKRNGRYYSVPPKRR